MNCANCQHDKRLHSLDITAREAVELGTASLYFDYGGQCIVWDCGCDAFTAAPLTVELDPELAREFVDVRGAVGQTPMLRVRDAIRRALEAQQ